jgi:hypothetical protein
VVDEEGAVADAPQRLALVQRLDQLALGRRQAEQVAGEGRLLGVLVVDDRGRGVGQQALGETHLAATGGAGSVQIAQPVHHDDVLHTVASRQLEGGL